MNLVFGTWSPSDATKKKLKIHITSQSYTLSKEQRHARPHRYLTKSVLSTPYHIHRAAIFSMHENA